MTGYARDLLRQAELLHGHDRLRPKQANLRRSVSATYYALFHGLCAECGRHLFGGWVDDPAMAAIIPRLFAHEQMKAACKAFARAGKMSSPEIGKGSPPKVLEEAFKKLNVPGLSSLHEVAACFVELQEARHTADYDLTQKLAREYARNWTQRVSKVFADWDGAKRSNPEAVALFGLCLLNWKTISQR